MVGADLRRTENRVSLENWRYFVSLSSGWCTSEGKKGGGILKLEMSHAGSICSPIHPFSSDLNTTLILCCL